MAGTIKKLYLSEGVSVTAPTELTFTGLGSYANDAAWVTANGTAVEGAMYVNTTLEVVRYYANSAWRSVLGASDPTDATKVLAIDVSGNTTGVTATLDFNATANRTYTFPNASMTVVGADTAQVLTAKDYDGGTASDTSRLTIPKAGTATLSALTRKEGTVVFDTDLDKPYYDNGSALVAFGSGAGGGGEKTYITNPSAADAITGWNAVGDLAVARSTTLAELPREFTTATGIKITADADVQSVADYVYYDFTLDDVDLSKKLKIQWSQKVTGTYTAGQLAVVITTQADRTTALHTPITTAIPASDGVFITSFDASTTATLSLVIRATADMTTSGGIVISDVIVGPGLITQGAVVSSLGTFAATASAGFGTVTGSDIKAWRIGNILRVKGRWANGTVAASTGSIDLPSGHTIDTSLLSTAASGTVVGGYTTTSSGGSVGLYSGGYSGVVFFDGSDTNTLFFGLNSAANAYTKSNVSGVLSGSSAPWDFEFSIPIAEWAGGSGTVNLATSESMGLPAVYEYTNWTPSGTGSTSTTPSAGSVTSTNAGITFSGPSSGTVTATINTQGYYQVSASVYHTHTNVYSDARFSCIFGGTASRRGLNSTTLAMAPGIDAQDVNNSQTVVYTVYATPGQTVTFQPTYISNGIAAAVDHTAYALSLIHISQGIVR